MKHNAIPEKVWDLSVPVADGVDWYYEEDCPPVQVNDIGPRANVGSLAEDGWVSHTLSLMVLNGTTYLETAAHIREGAPTLDQIPPDRLIVRAFVIPLVPQGRLLSAPDRPPPGFIPETDAMLLACGWDAHVHTRDYYFGSPYFSPQLQQWLLCHRPAILGGDMLSFDAPEDTSMPFIHGFFATGGMILCPLMGLADLPPVVTLCAAPVKLAAANAAPCRALAWT